MLSERIQRIGLHSGRAVSESGGFYGREVNFAARIADQAAGGEIVASAAIKTHLDATVGKFGSARLVELKGFSGTHELWPVVISGKPGKGGST